MSIATYKGWKIHQLDVKSTVLNEPLDEEDNVIQPLGFKIKGKELKVYMLRKICMA